MQTLYEENYFVYFQEHGLSECALSEVDSKGCGVKEGTNAPTLINYTQETPWDDLSNLEEHTELTRKFR